MPRDADRRYGPFLSGAAGRRGVNRSAASADAAPVLHCSSQAEVESEVHVTVGVVRYEIEGRARAGGASSFLADRVEEDGEVASLSNTTTTSVCRPTRRRR
jgi:hypothetical protein